jgi:hypothetical protein
VFAEVKIASLESKEQPLSTPRAFVASTNVAHVILAAAYGPHTPPACLNRTPWAGNDRRIERACPCVDSKCVGTRQAAEATKQQREVNAFSALKAAAHTVVCFLNQKNSFCLFWRREESKIRIPPPPPRADDRQLCHRPGIQVQVHRSEASAQGRQQSLPNRRGAFTALKAAVNIIHTGTDASR